MKNIFLIKTKHESSLFKTEEGILLYNHSIEKRNCKSQFLYITNNKEIEYDSFGNRDVKIGEYLIDIKEKIVDKVSHIWEVFNFKGTLQFPKEEDLHLNRHSTFNCQKIIATNDTSLIEDGVQAVDNLFLSFFVENQPDYVEVIKGFTDGTSYGYNFLDYKLDFPKEKLYSKKDLEIAFNQGCTYTVGSHELFKQTHLNFEEWFKQV